MTAFRGLLILIIAVLGTYTAMVGFNHGWSLFPVFFGDLAAMTWAGQFNADFTGFLLLSGLWLSWRHHFSPGGLALGIAGFFGGMMLLAPNLVYATFKEDGDIRAVLLGPVRAAATAVRP
jgi:hypothetical protein